jgi:hypothetical protein
MTSVACHPPTQPLKYGVAAPTTTVVEANTEAQNALTTRAAGEGYTRTNRTIPAMTIDPQVLREDGEIAMIAGR